MSVADLFLRFQKDIDMVYAKGKGVAMGEFSDVYQNYGDRQNYQYAYAGWGWNDQTFQPKHPISCSDTDATAPENSLNAANVFYNSRMTEITVPVSITGIPTSNLFSRNSQLRRVEKLTLSGVSKITTPFNGCTALEHIIFAGSIDVNLGISSTAVLDSESCQSIINCLKDLTGGATQTLTLHNTVGNGLTQAQKAAITAKNWTLVY